MRKGENSVIPTGRNVKMGVPATVGREDGTGDVTMRVEVPQQPGTGRPQRVARRLREVPAILQDLVLVAVISTLQVAVLAPSAPRPVVAVLVAVEPLLLLLRRSHPTVTIGLVAVADVGLIFAGAASEAVGASTVVAAYSAGAHQPRPRSLWSLALALAGLVAIGAVPAARLTPVDVAGAFAVTSIAWWLGSTLRERRYYAAELEQRTLALEAARLELADRAVAAERLRLARELHDVVAHSLAVIALHSSVGAHNAASRPADAIAALDAINTATRSALGELRAMLAVLRDGDPDATESPQAAPLPSLADLSSLIDHARKAGIRVELSVSGDLESVPRAVSLSAYRIVQEALTNVVKHAGPVGADVTVEVSVGRIAVAITNGPPRGAAVVAGGRQSSVPGSGLTGMRERVAAFDGDFSAQATADGGWTVHATLTFEEPE